MALSSKQSYYDLRDHLEWQPVFPSLYMLFHKLALRKQLQKTATSLHGVPLGIVFSCEEAALEGQMSLCVCVCLCVPKLKLTFNLLNVNL